jgi:hypothetical protein
MPGPITLPYARSELGTDYAPPRIGAWEARSYVAVTCSGALLQSKRSLKQGREWLRAIGRMETIMIGLTSFNLEESDHHLIRRFAHHRGNSIFSIIMGRHADMDSANLTDYENN